ncbi:hypothetical protein [Pleionea sediminis]|uniref:hypothetical protein n=1 Tax=Pleionea sediminis TaxID=2569479 RepID=UPI001186A809|nr:hypothetical protein [Pleionea sediminis]
MSNQNNFDLELKELKEATTDKWLMQQSLDLAAFESLYTYLEQKSELLKDQSTVSKQLVQVILDAFNALESAGNIQQANKFMVLLGLIVRNEAASDRKSGVPRII